MLRVEPLLQIQRELCQIPRGPERFSAYVELMHDRNQQLLRPLHAFNPMCREHVNSRLDELLDCDAEGIADEALLEAEDRLGDLGNYRMGMVLADDIAGSWTNRDLVEVNDLRADLSYLLDRGWFVLTLWVSDEPSEESIRQQTLACVYRTFWIQRYGPAKTLGEALRIAGQSLLFAGINLPKLSDEHYDTIAEYANLYAAAELFAEFPTAFTILRGDLAAVRVGYPPLGIPDKGGLAFALEQAQHAPSPEVLFNADRWERSINPSDSQASSESDSQSTSDSQASSESDS
jgi:hypothetical protein